MGHDGIGNEQGACRARREADARVREITNERLLDIQRLTRIKLDTDTAGITAVDVEPSQIDNVICAGADRHADAARREHPGHGAFARYGDRFVDGHRAIVCRIEHVDRASGKRQRQCRLKSAARRRYGAGITVAA